MKSFHDIVSDSSSSDESNENASTDVIIKEEMDHFQKEKEKKKEERKNNKDNLDDENKGEEDANEDDENKTDKKLFDDILKDESEDDDETRVVVGDDEDFIEVDGVKTVSFSLKKEMKEGQFDKRGNYIPNKEEEENEENHTYSTETTEDEGNSNELYISSLKQLISLIPPQKNATEALQASASDSERLIAITDCATNLLSLGEMKIYTESIDELKEKLQKPK